MCVPMNVLVPTDRQTLSFAYYFNTFTGKYRYHSFWLLTEVLEGNSNFRGNFKCLFSECSFEIKEKTRVPQAPSFCYSSIYFHNVLCQALQPFFLVRPIWCKLDFEREQSCSLWLKRVASKALNHLGGLRKCILASILCVCGTNQVRARPRSYQASERWIIRVYGRFFSLSIL